MSDQPSRLQYLLQQYAENNCSPAELLELMEALNENGNDEELKNSLFTIWQDIKPDESLANIDKEQIFSNIMKSAFVEKLPHKNYNTLNWVAAAVVLFFIGFAIYFLKPENKIQATVTTIHHPGIILPGSNKAELTLANGKKIILKNSSGSQITTAGGTTIIRLDKGQLAFSGSIQAADEGGLPAYNILSTPTGGQYQVTLPDGTRVWLNASSSLRFPTAFNGKTRHVELTGEGYFEVAKDKSKPFSVDVNNGEIKVLGTHFNIMGYQDEASTNTTLLEGSVQITRGKNIRMLIPGEQARVDNESHIQITPVDPAAAIEWKNGNFNFSHEKIQSIMRKLSRWYNISVEYQGKPTTEGFVGTLPRSKNLNEVLNTLESTGLVHFKIEERRVVVMP